MRSDLNTEDEFVEDDWYVDEEDSEIDGDCNESQPCRGDEPWLDNDLLALRAALQQHHERSAHRALMLLVLVSVQIPLGANFQIFQIAQVEYFKRDTVVFRENALGNPGITRKRRKQDYSICTIQLVVISEPRLPARYLR